MANNINILGDLVSQDAVKRVEELANAVEKIATQSEKFISNLGGVSGSTGGNTAKQEADLLKLDALNKKLEEQMKQLREKNTESLKSIQEQNAIRLAKLQEQLDSQREKRQESKVKSNMTVAEKVDRSYSIAQEKLEAQSVSQLATELQRLYAQQELANREAQKIASTIGMESKEFFEASKKAKDLTAEIIKLETATGKMAGKATNTNYALFSLTQVVRELPNFAMSARIGFMSLSNNLPQLVDGFTTLKNSVDETGKKLGNIGALKAFISSLMSLNTVVIIATTLMVAYGDKVWKWIESMFKAVDVTDRYSLATKTLLKVFSDTSSEANKTTERMLHLGIAIDKYKSGTLTASEQTKQANWIVKEYNETLGIHDKKINNVSEAIIGYNNNAKKFIEYTIAMNASMLSMQESANQLQRARGAEVSMNAIIPDAKSRQELNKLFYDLRQNYINLRDESKQTESQASNEFASLIENGDLVLKGYNRRKELNKEESKLFWDNHELQKRFLKDLTKYGEDNLKEYLKQLTIKDVATNKSLKARKDAEYFYRFDETKDPKNPKGDNTVQTARTKLIAEEFYDKQRIELVKQLAKLEEDIAKERLDGTLNDYKVRKEANEKYYSISQALAETDKEVAIKNLDSKTAKELEELQKVDDENQKKFKARKITQEELTRANAVNADSEKNLIANHEAELLKIRDEYEKKTIENTKKFAQEDRKIMQDLYNDEVYLINEEARIKEKYAEYTSKLNVLERKKSNSTGNLLSGFSGFQKDTSFDELAEAHNLAQEKIKIKSDEIKDKLLIVKKGSEEEKQLIRQNEQLIKDSVVETSNFIIDVKTKELEKRQALEKNLVQKGNELILALYKGFFDKYIKMLDKQHEKEKRISDERLKDVEDKEEKGVYTKLQAEKKKEEINAYALGQEEEINRKKAEAEKTKFLFEQGIALAKVAMTTAQGVAEATAMSAITAGASLGLIPLIIATGAVEAGIILAQTIPEFKDGGIMPHSGMALVGDGGKNEVLITPSGKIGITPNKDTYMHLEAGTRILPDANKFNLDSLVAYMNVEKSQMSTKILEDEIKGLRKDLNNKKQPILSNVPLMRTIEFSKQLDNRKNGI